MIDGMILCWRWMDESLQNALVHMNNAPSEIGSMVDFAKALGAIIALMVGAAECYMMMLGRKGIDTMKLLRIAIIAVAIGESSNIVTGLNEIFNKPAEAVKDKLDKKIKVVDDLKESVSVQRALLVYRLDSARYEAEKVRYEAEYGEGLGTAIGSVVGTAKNLTANVLGGVAAGGVWLSNVCGGAIMKYVITWIAETIFQVVTYGVIIGQKVFLGILGIFLPFILALSLAPPFRNAWSQWLSKYVSVSLWSTVTYIALFYFYFLLQGSMQQDLQDMNALVAKTAQDGSIFDNASAMFKDMWADLGNTTFMAVVFLIGAYIIRQVPEMCSWLMPGGVASHWGQTAGGFASRNSVLVQGGKMAVTKVVGSVASGGTAAVAGTAASVAASAGKAAGGAVKGPKP